MLQSGARALSAVLQSGLLTDISTVSCIIGKWKRLGTTTRPQAENRVKSESGSMMRKSHHYSPDSRAEGMQVMALAQ